MAFSESITRNTRNLFHHSWSRGGIFTYNVFFSANSAEGYCCRSNSLAAPGTSLAGRRWQLGAKTRMRSLGSSWPALRCVWRSLEIPLMRLSHRMRRFHSHITDSPGVGTRRLCQWTKNLVDELSKSNPANTIFKLLAADHSPSLIATAPHKSSCYSKLPHSTNLAHLHYLRGLAYFGLNQPTRAANQFQKMVDHRGCVQSFLLGTIVHLLLAHGFAAPGGNIKERAAYQDFLDVVERRRPGHSHPHCCQVWVRKAPLVPSRGQRFAPSVTTGNTTYASVSWRQEQTSA